MCRAGRAFAGWVGTLSRRVGWVGTRPDASTTEPVAAERSGQRTRVSTGRGPAEGRPPATAEPSRESFELSDSKRACGKDTGGCEIVPCSHSR